MCGPSLTETSLRGEYLYVFRTVRYSDCQVFVRSKHYIFLRLAKQSQFIPLQNVVYFITLRFLVRKIFTFYINDVLLFKCPFPGPKG